MKRVLIVGTIALLASLLLGSATGQGAILDPFAATDTVSSAIKLALIGVLVSLLVTFKPRSIQFRTFLGVVSAALTFGTVAMLSMYIVPILDAVIYIEIAIILAIEAAESPALLTGRGKKITVNYFPQNEKLVL